MTQVPASSVTTVRVNPVSVWVAVTVTPGKHGVTVVGDPAAQFGRGLRPGGGAGEKEHERADDDVADGAHQFTSIGLNAWSKRSTLRIPPVGRRGRPLGQQSGSVCFGHLAEPRKRLARNREPFDGDLIADAERVLLEPLAEEPGSRSAFEAPHDELAVLVGGFDIELAVRTPVLPPYDLALDLDEILLLLGVVAAWSDVRMPPRSIRVRRPMTTVISPPTVLVTSVSLL